MNLGSDMVKRKKRKNNYFKINLIRGLCTSIQWMIIGTIFSFSMGRGFDAKRNILPYKAVLSDKRHVYCIAHTVLGNTGRDGTKQSTRQTNGNKKTKKNAKNYNGVYQQVSPYLCWAGQGPGTLSSCLRSPASQYSD